MNYCDIAIIHSWKSKKETDEYRKYLKSEYKIDSVTIMRDMKIHGQDCLRILTGNKNILS